MDGQTEKFYYPNGLKDKDTCIYYISDELIIALNANGGGVKPYGNRLYLPQGGAFYTHFKTQLTKMVNEMSGLKLKGDQVQSVFGGYLAFFVNNRSMLGWVLAGILSVIVLILVVALANKSNNG